VERPHPLDALTRAEARTDRRGPRADVPADAVEALERVVTRLQREVDGLRNALRYRAVIEQAKGVLVARLGIEPDVAFRRMVRRSQDQNRKLTAVAAGVIAQALRGVTDRGEAPDDASEEVVHLQLAAAAYTAAPGIAALTTAIVEELADLGVTGAVLLASEPDGTLRLLHDVGLGPTSADGWERIPLAADVPLSEAARTGRPVLLPDRDARVRAHPGSRHVASIGEASASMPLFHGNRLVGVLGLTWDARCEFDDATARRLQDTAVRIAPRMLELLRQHREDGVCAELEPAHADWFHRVLDTLPTPIVLLEPKRDDGRIVDLIVLHANRASHPGPAPVGRGLLEHWPQLLRTELLDRVGGVLAGRSPWGVERFTIPGSPGRPGLELDELHVTRVGSVVVLSCRTVRPAQDERSNR
jgi:hypothetical protein